MQSEHRGSLVESASRSVRGLLGRLTGLFLLLAVSPLVIASVLILHNGQVALEENIGLQLSAQAEHIAESLDHLMADGQASLRDWAKLPVMNDLSGGDAGGRITETLTALAQGQSVWSSLMAISPGGKVVAASRPHWIGESVADQTWFQHKPMESHLKWQPFQWKTQEGGYYSVTPIFREGKSRSLIGYLSAYLSPAQLDNHVRGILSPLSPQSNGAHGSVLLFNDKAGMLFLSQPEPAQDSVQVVQDRFSQDWLQDLRKSQADTPSPLRKWASLTAKDGRQFLVGHTGEQGRPRAGSFVGVARPLDQAYGPIYELQRQIVGIGFVLAGLAAVLAIFVANRLGRPIEQLTKSAEAVASGDFAPNRLPVWRQDEIGSLARTFDRMREDLQLFTKDLEERVQARTAELESVNRQLQRQHAFLRQVLDMNPNFIFAKDRDGRFTLANLAVADAYGTSVDTLVGRTDADFSARADEAERIQRDDLAVVEKGQEHVIAEEALTDATGKVRWLRTVKRPLVGPDGRHDQVLSVAVDITALREALHAVRLSEQRFHQMVGQVKDYSIVMLDPGGLVVHWNDGAQRIMGYTAGDIVGRHFSYFYSAEDAGGDKLTRLLAQAAEQGSVEDEGWRLRKDGSKFWVRAAIAAIYDEAGKLIGFSQLTRDLTVQKEAESDKTLLEAQLRQAQKMEAVGRLAGGIAHDFNNLLTVITGFSEILQMSIKPEDPLQQAVQEIVKAAGRAANLTQQLLAFSRKQVIQPTQLSLNDVVAQIERLLHKLIGEDIQLEPVFADDLALVRADRGQIDQVIMNLAVNARDAMPKGGRMLLRTDNIVITPELGEPTGIVKPGRYACLEVRDTGCGMDEETKARVFEPFFTTKESGKGTGLGLSTVYGIVKQSGGFVTVESELGKGASFRVYFPAVETESPAAPQADGTHLIKPFCKEKEATILLVEDEAGIRRLFQELLASYGYKVLTAQDGEAGVTVGGSYSGPIDLLVTDVVMPNLSGVEMAQRLLSKYPRLKVLYMSGHTDESIVQHGVLEPGVAFLSKPFKPQVLVDRVQQILMAA